MENSTEVISQYRFATKKMIRSFFNQLAGDDPDEYARCSLVISSGGMIQARTCLSPTGLFETVIEVTDVAGTTLEIGRVEDAGVVNH